MNKSLGHSTKAWSSRTYNSWRAMIARCQNPNHQKYRIYGARGIKVCPRWDEFAEFLADMGEAPEGCTLDRIDNDADYSPANCRWSTQQTQQRNRRNNVRYTLNGVSASLSTWCEQFDIPYSTAQNRLRNGSTIERALTKGRLASRVQPPDGTTELPQVGTWTLTAPDGRSWCADSPLKACGMEQRERVPASIAVARIIAAINELDPDEAAAAEAAIEAAFWQFDARRKGYAEWRQCPQSERDAFKAEARALVRGYWPTPLPSEAVCAEPSGRSARSDSKEPSKSSSIQAESPSADRDASEDLSRAAGEAVRRPAVDE